MKSKLIVAVFLFLPIITWAHPPENLGVLKKKVIQYHESGAYKADFSKITHQAAHYLADRVRENHHATHPKKLAVILDIDETSLSNYKNIKKLNFGGTLVQENLAEARGDDPAIASMLRLYHYAINHHVTVFFVTGRDEKYRSATVKNLKAVGYMKWAHLYMKPNDYQLSSVIPYKTACRKAIAREGYDIVLNMGDQKSDLAGGYSDSDYKLPNYMYYIP